MFCVLFTAFLFYYYFLKLSVEAHIRIPSNSSLANGASAIFTMTAYLNGIINPLLTQSVSGIVKDPAPLIVPLSSKVRRFLKICFHIRISLIKSDFYSYRT